MKLFLLNALKSLYNFRFRGAFNICDFKLTAVDGEASWSLLPISVSLLLGSTVKPENTYSRILKVTGQV